MARGGRSNWIVGGERVILEARLEARQDICVAPIVGFLLRNRYGQHLLATIPTSPTGTRPLIVRKGPAPDRKIFLHTMPILEKGDYSISIAVAERHPG